MKQSHKHITISSETKIIAMSIPKENGQRRNFIKLMESAEKTYTKKRVESLRKLNKDTSDE